MIAKLVWVTAYKYKVIRTPNSISIDLIITIMMVWLFFWVLVWIFCVRPAWLLRNLSTLIA